MYGIKLYIHNDTPPKATPKPLKLLGYIAAALIYLPFAGAAFTAAMFFCRFYFSYVR